jgi:hypothetical protein
MSETTLVVDERTDIDLEAWLNHEFEQVCELLLPPLKGNGPCLNTAEWIMYVKKYCSCSIPIVLLICTPCKDRAIVNGGATCGACKQFVKLRWIDRSK